MNTTELQVALHQTLTTTDLTFLGPKTQGKVRDIYQQGDQLVLITTDRLSAFDRILGAVPYKGQVLNQLAFLQVNHLVNQAVIRVFNQVVSHQVNHQDHPVVNQF